MFDCLVLPLHTLLRRNWKLLCSVLHTCSVTWRQRLCILGRYGAIEIVLLLLLLLLLKIINQHQRYTRHRLIISCRHACKTAFLELETQLKNNATAREERRQLSLHRMRNDCQSQLHQVCLRSHTCHQRYTHTVNRTCIHEQWWHRGRGKLSSKNAKCGAYNSPFWRNFGQN